MTQTEIENVITTLELKVTALENKVASMETDIGFKNKLLSLIDIDIDVHDLLKNDLLQYNGFKWTNIRDVDSNIGLNTGIRKLSKLEDVEISTSLSDGQCLSWDNNSSKWINKTVSSSSGGSGIIDTNMMWNELRNDDSSKAIHPSHIQGDLSIGKLTCSGGLNCNSGSTNLSVTNTGISANGNIADNGNIQATGEITAMK